jgi:dTDP-4-dehydrorhamnose reductase
MRILVTGANGLVGSRVLWALARRGHEVIATSRGPARVKVPGEYQLNELSHVTGTYDIIVNCAGMTDVDGCERDPAGAWAVNVEAVTHLARQSAHLVHLSTDYIFDGTHGPYDVTAIPNPRGVYATSKLAAELAVKTLSPSWAIARTAVVFGWPAASHGNFGSWLVSTMRAGQPVKLFDDQWVSPTLALNVAEMVAELADTKCKGVFHTAGAEVIDRVTFGHKLAKRFGFDASLIHPTHMRDVALSIPRPVHSGLIVTDSLHTKPLTVDQALDQFFAETQ